MNMTGFLFRRLTSAPKRGQPLFAALIARARESQWYVEGEVPDTLDGRFAMLSTLCAIATVRLERGGEDARAQAVALAERFVETMDSEHREMGLGDPGLGKTVRKLLGALARRVELWRPALDTGPAWDEAVTSSIFRGSPPQSEALAHVARKLRLFWDALEAAPDSGLCEGKFE